jgi:hypothetical protein
MSHQPPLGRDSTIEFTESDYFTGPKTTDEMIAVAEARLGVRLPAAYVRLLSVRNGGEPVRHCYPVPFPTSWADDHIDVGAILGVGGERGIDADTCGAPRSAYMVAEWGYPPVGVVICDTPSGGHDTVMLDYSGDDPEPAVVYVDEDREPRRIADTFEEFLANLADCQP